MVLSASVKQVFKTKQFKHPTWTPAGTVSNASVERSLESKQVKHSTCLNILHPSKRSCVENGGMYAVQPEPIA
eukprot:406019-Pelagomonas_calceolata.AAC.7